MNGGRHRGRRPGAVGLAAHAGAFLLAAAAACAPESSAVTETVRDSAGVRIIDTQLWGDTLPRFAAVASPELRIGVLEGPDAYTFTRVVDVRSLGDGGVLVAEGNSAEIRVFDAAGRHVVSFGGRGEGPGEFSLLTGVAGLSGDTVRVWDARSQRLTSFLLDGELLGTQPNPDASSVRLLTVERMHADGYLGRSSYVAPGSEGETTDGEIVPVRDSLVLHHLDARLARRDTVAVLAGAEYLEAVTGSAGSGGGTMFRVQRMGRHFSRDAYFAAGPLGIVMGESDAFEWMMSRPDGSVSHIVRVPALERPVTPAQISDLGDYLRSVAPTQEIGNRMAAGITDYPLPEALPAYRGLEIDAAARVWLSGYQVVPEGPTLWYVFSPEGRLNGTVETPAGLTVHEVGIDFILGVVRDEFDVPYVVRLPLRIS